MIHMQVDEQPKLSESQEEQLALRMTCVEQAILEEGC
jgi:hypothetical protein